MVDLTKPVRCRDIDGAVRILCTDAPGDFPIIGLVEGHNTPFTWAENGKFRSRTSALPDGRDLINMPEPQVWVELPNVNEPMVGGEYPTHIVALQDAVLELRKHIEALEMKLEEKNA